MTAELDQKPRRIRNISELAKLAGVSAGTVSRALAGKELVNQQTRERIQALAREHGFRPNQMASRLRTGQTGVIGVVIPLGHEKKQHISDPFFMTMLGHLADGLTEGGYDLMLSRVIPADGDDWLERIVDSGMLDGVLMIGQSDQFETIERIAEIYRPLVVWGTQREGQRHCVVGTDSFTGGRLAAQQLLSPPQLSMVTPTPHSYKLNTDFSIRQGTGTVTQPLVYLADGGCDANIDSVTGKIALFKAIERPCGCVVVHGGTTFVRGSVEVCKTHVSPCV